MITASAVLAHLHRARSEWPEALVPPRAHTRLVAAAPGLPEPFTGLSAECHLSHPTRTDFGVRVSRGDRDECLRGGRCPEAFRSFFTTWADESHPASRVLWVDVECDVDDEGSQPFLSPGLEPDLPAGIHAILRSQQSERAAGGEHSALVLGWPVLRAIDPSLPDSLFVGLKRCCDALPSPGVLIPVWSGGSRPGALPDPAIRAVVALPEVAFRDYLTSLGWSGDIAALERHADLLSSSGPWVGFDVDIGAHGLGPRIGLYQEHAWVRPWDADLAATIERLHRLRLCVPERLDGLRAWVASQPEKPAPGHARSLTLKVVVNGRQALTVKAYVSAFDEAHATRALRDAARAEATSGAGLP